MGDHSGQPSGGPGGPRRDLPGHIAGQPRLFIGSALLIDRRQVGVALVDKIPATEGVSRLGIPEPGERPDLPLPRSAFGVGELWIPPVVAAPDDDGSRLDQGLPVGEKAGAM